MRILVPNGSLGVTRYVVPLELAGLPLNTVTANVTTGAAVESPILTMVSRSGDQIWAAEVDYALPALSTVSMVWSTNVNTVIGINSVVGMLAMPGMPVEEGDIIQINFTANTTYVSVMMVFG